MKVSFSSMDAQVSSYAFPVPVEGGPSPFQPNTSNSAVAPSASVTTGSGAPLLADADPLSPPLAGADSLPDTPGVVFASARRKPWQILQDTAREHGVSLSKQEAIKLAQQQNQQSQRDAAAKGKSEAGNGDDGQAEFSVTGAAAHLFNEVGDTLSSSLHTIESNPLSLDALGAAAVLAVVGGLTLAAA